MSAPTPAAATRAFQQRSNEQLLKKRADFARLNPFYKNNKAVNALVEDATTPLAANLDYAIDLALQRAALIVVGTQADQAEIDQMVGYFEASEQKQFKAHIAAFQALDKKANESACAADEVGNYRALQAHKAALSSADSKQKAASALTRCRLNIADARDTMPTLEDDRRTQVKALIQNSRTWIKGSAEDRRQLQKDAIEGIADTIDGAYQQAQNCALFHPNSAEFDALQSYNEASALMRQCHPCGKWEVNLDPTTQAQVVSLAEAKFDATGRSPHTDTHPKTDLAASCRVKAVTVKKSNAGSTSSRYETHHAVVTRFDKANAELAHARTELNNVLQNNTGLLAAGFGNDDTATLNTKYTKEDAAIQKATQAYKKAATEHRLACIALYHAAHLGSALSMHPAAQALLRNPASDANQALLAGLPKHMAEKVMSTRNNYLKACTSTNTLKIVFYDRRARPRKYVTHDLDITQAELPDLIQYLRENDPEAAGMIAEFTQAEDSNGNDPSNALLNISVDSSGNLNVSYDSDKLKELVDIYQSHIKEIKADFKDQHGRNPSTQEIEVAYMEKTGMRAPISHSKRPGDLVRILKQRIIAVSDKYKDAKKAQEGKLDASKGSSNTTQSGDPNNVTVTRNPAAEAKDVDVSPAHSL